MPKWTAFPYENKAFQYTLTSLKKNWSRLHQGDAEPWPKDEAVAKAWIHFHAGDYKKAVDAGLKAGGGGVTCANKAQSMYATYLEKNEKTKLELYLEVAERAEAQQAEEPHNPNAFYWQAYALGRYGQGITVAKALSQGLGIKIKFALETAIELAPKHADAHLALGTFHAEVIDKVGPLLGKTQGADPATGLKLLTQAGKLNPKSAIGMIERANGMVMLEGEKRLEEAEALYQQAAHCEPMDAMECLDIELARSELED